jgi:very-short-patch-repair endonuclease
MGAPTAQPWSEAAWRLVNRQHGVVTRAQLIELGLSPKAIQHRLGTGRLHPLMRGIYVVGRPQVGLRGRWMAAVLAGGPKALLSHRSAAALWGIRGWDGGEVEIVVPLSQSRRRLDVRVYGRRRHDAPESREVKGISVVHPIAVLVDLATCVPTGQLETAINEADHHGLVNPERLLRALDELPPWAGIGRLRKMLEGPIVTLSTTELESRFLPLARAVGLPSPHTQVWLDGHRVDFYWPHLDLVVEADSLRYHRTALKQSRDKRRDNDHTRAGRASLRFSHGQIRYEPVYVRATLAATARRLRSKLSA